MDVLLFNIQEDIDAFCFFSVDFIEEDVFISSGSKSSSQLGKKTVLFGNSVSGNGEFVSEGDVIVGDNFHVLNSLVFPFLKLNISTVSLFELSTEFSRSSSFFVEFISSVDKIWD